MSKYLDHLIELIDDNDRLWATVEHSGDICKFVIYNDTNGSTALVMPRRLLADLSEALKLGVPEREAGWDLQTR